MYFKEDFLQNRNRSAIYTDNAHAMVEVTIAHPCRDKVLSPKTPSNVVGILGKHRLMKFQCIPSFQPKISTVFLSGDAA